MKGYLISHFIGLFSLIALMFLFGREPYNFILAIIVGSSLNMNLILYNELHSKLKVSETPSKEKLK